VRAIFLLSRGVYNGDALVQHNYDLVDELSVMGCVGVSNPAMLGHGFFRRSGSRILRAGDGEKPHRVRLFQCGYCSVGLWLCCVIHVARTDAVSS
jgi:hypothetical protein